MNYVVEGLLQAIVGMAKRISCRIRSSFAGADLVVGASSAAAAANRIYKGTIAFGHWGFVPETMAISGAPLGTAFARRREAATGGRGPLAIRAAGGGRVMRLGARCA